MAEELWDEMKRYVGFGEADERHLRALAPRLGPHFVEIVEEFYRRITAHPGAAAVLESERQIERLKGTLRTWLAQFFAGPWDQPYFEQRARIGRRHVEISLGQHYMLTAMNVIRRQVVDLILTGPTASHVKREETASVEKLFDLELAIMLHTYREDYLKQLQRQERLATFGQLTSTIAHELRNPLGVMESSLYLLQSRLPDDGDARRHLDKIRAQVRRSNRLITSMLDLVRDKAPRRTRVAPAEIAAEAVRVVEDERQVRVTADVAPDLPVLQADASQVQQVLGNLLANAADAAGPGGQVHLAVSRVGDHVRFVVSDSGPGVDPAMVPRLFEPLFTTKHGGTGLGLALCKKIALAHGGALALGKGALPGAAFVFDLPVR
jgi:signal transduction histidine kinase